MLSPWQSSRTLFRVAEGCPPAAIAAYEIGINSSNLFQFREVQRIKQDYWMRAQMQVELSGIPFPDDSPVKFPSEEKWRFISLRRDKYQNDGLTDTDPETTRKVRLMKAKLDKPVVLEKGLEKMTFGEAKTYFEDRFRCHDPGQRGRFQGERTPTLLQNILEVGGPNSKK